MTSSRNTRALTTCATLGLAALAVVVAPRPAHAWWQHGWGIGVYVAPVVVAPPPVYYAPPPYYPAPVRAWIPAHWQGGYWVPGHWS